MSTLESELFFDHSIIRSETHKLLYEAIESLPEQTKKIIYLTLDGLKNQEIADQLNVSINTVTTLKKSGYKKLKIMLKEHYYLVVLLFP